MRVAPLLPKAVAREQFDHGEDEHKGRDGPNHQAKQDSEKISHYSL